MAMRLYDIRKGKAIPVTGLGGPRACETSRLPHFLDNPLADGREFARLKSRLPFTHKQIPATDFSQGLSRPQGWKD
jgi:hypothetical protein